ncbi:MAG: CPBP family intramembrane glutamic endopeptidase [Symbiobacteriia bacterium]
MILLTGLLILRLPVELLSTHFRSLLGLTAYVALTPVLTVLLIFAERRRLQEFHIDGWALLLYISAPLVGWAIYRNGFFNVSEVLPAAPIAALCLAAGLLLTRTRLPRFDWRTLAWMGGAIVLGLAAAVVFGVGEAMSHQIPGLMQEPASVVWGWAAPQILREPLYQLAGAASLEEPLFRGFLWGYLKQARWQDHWIWLLQAGLFMLGHFYYFGRLWFSFWILVPASALFLGWLAWRSRSIAPGMLAHSIMNSFSFLIAHVRW